MDESSNSDDGLIETGVYVEDMNPDETWAVQLTFVTSKFREILDAIDEEAQKADTCSSPIKHFTNLATMFEALGVAGLGNSEQMAKQAQDLTNAARAAIARLN